MIRCTARELLRREDWLGRLTSRQSPRSSFLTQAVFSTSRAATVEPARVEDTPVETPALSHPALDFNNPREAYKVRNENEILKTSPF